MAQPQVTITRLRPSITRVTAPSGSIGIVTAPAGATTVILMRSGPPGPPGTAGAPGADGAPGAPGAPGGQYTEFTFVSASDTWNLPHNYGRKANITLYTMGGVKMESEVIQLSNNTAQARFDEPTAGYAIAQ